MICWCCFLMLEILLLQLLIVLIIVKLFIKLAHLIQLICQKTLRLMIVDMQKIHFEEINIKKSQQVLFWLLNERKKIETKVILINEKSYKDLVSFFTRYDRRKSIRMLSLYYHKTIGNIKEYEWKQNLMVDYNISHKALKKIKEVIILENWWY